LIIKAEKLSKTYGDFTAVEEVNLSISRGEIYGFLGPNGAGKTTTIQILTGVIPPTSGRVMLFGKPFTPENRETKLRFGVVPENHPSGFWPWLTAGEYLEFFADLFSVPHPGARISELLGRVGLEKVRDKKIREFSRGMLQKLSILRAVLHSPDILFLDEPISGLDPLGIKQVRDLILEENREGRTVLVSSHILSEVEKICTRGAVISQGRVRMEGEMSRFISMLSPEKIITVEADEIPDRFDRQLAALPFVAACTAGKKRLQVTLSGERDYRKELSGYLYGQGIIPVVFREETATLEDAFISITNETLERIQ